MKNLFNKYYGWASRYRGSKSKLIGCLLLSAPFLLIYYLLWILVFSITGLVCWYAIAYITVAVIVGVVNLFWWTSDSDNWRNTDVISKLYKKGGIISFSLLGCPFLGVKMRRVGNLFEKYFTNTSENKYQQEIETGWLFWPQHFKALAIHIILVGVLEWII